MDHKLPAEMPRQSAPARNGFHSAERHRFRDQLTLAHEHYHAVLIVESGMGTLSMNGRSYPVSAGRCYYALPDMPLSLEPYFNEISAIVVCFERLVLQERSPDTVSYLRESDGFAPWGELSVGPPERLLHLAAELLQAGKSVEPPDTAYGDRLFHEWMHELVQANVYPAKETYGNEEAIRRIMRHIDLHYHEELKRDALAQMAGFSPEYFSALFKGISGCSLTDYVTGLRIRHIKERLLFAGTRLGDVAKEVGYKDEYYVSRRFKHEVGLSPTAYVQSPKRILSLNPHLTMHLLALGVVPAATASYPWGFGEYDAALQAAGCECRDWTMEYTMREMADLRPELIVGIDNLDHARLHDCRQLAPTLVVPWYVSDWRGHFRTLAQVCRRSDAERDWLARFHEQTSALRRQLAASGITRQTAAIVNIREEATFLYLNRGMGSQVVYAELKLAPPPEVRAAVADRASVPIDPDDILPRYEADHMIVIASPAPAAQAKAADLLGSKPWQAYLARGGRVHRADMRRWHGYDPLSIQWQLTDIKGWFS